MGIFFLNKRIFLVLVILQIRLYATSDRTSFITVVTTQSLLRNMSKAWHLMVIYESLQGSMDKEEAGWLRGQIRTFVGRYQSVSGARQ